MLAVTYAQYYLATWPRIESVLAGDQYTNGVDMFVGIRQDPLADDLTTRGTFGPSGSIAGTFVWPVEANVLETVQYGANGTEFTGTLTTEGVTPIYPPTTDVRRDVAYGDTGTLQFVGVYDPALESDHRLGTQYGANGVEFTGQWNGGTGDPGDVEWIG